MASSDYAFVTRWRVEATIEEVCDVLSDVLALPQWWPSVYLGVEELAPGDPQSQIGREIELFTKGWLPYSLRWSFRVTESNRPHGFAIEALGDFVGRGVWTLEQDGPVADITYDWRIRADKPLLRTLSFLLKPVFSANHRWAMERGEESLRLELLRRRAKTEAERNAVPPPPGPTFASMLPKT
jgi:hypothetical protein